MTKTSYTLEYKSVYKNESQHWRRYDFYNDLDEARKQLGLLSAVNKNVRLIKLETTETIVEL